MIGFTTSSGNTCQIPTGSRHCINTWQSWLFSPANLPLSTFTQRAILKAYQSGNFRDDTNFKNSFLSFSFMKKKMQDPFRFNHCPYSSINLSVCSSRRALIVSFILPSISRIVPTNVSKTFFSTCITSRLFLNFSFDKYGSSKNIGLCVQFICVEGLVWLTVFPNGAKSKRLSCSKIWSSDHSLGLRWCSVFPSNSLSFPRRSWSHGNHLRWPR